LGKPDVGGCDSEGFLLALGELVEHFQITWTVSPLHDAASAEGVEAGFVLDLEGRHGPVADHVARSCSHCTNLLLALQIIGDWLFPPKGLCEPCELRTYDNFVRGENLGVSEPCSGKTFRLASRVGTACHLGSCPLACGAALRGRLNRIGAVERGNDLNFTEGTESGT
jgi:hypothetical protein